MLVGGSTVFVLYLLKVNDVPNADVVLSNDLGVNNVYWVHE